MSIMPLQSNWIQSLESSAKLLILSNLAVILFALYFNWNVMTVLWGYWLQSVIIGFFTAIRILIEPQNISAEDLFRQIARGDLRWPAAAPGFLIRALTATFFTFHYGMFHMGYFVFLLAFSGALGAPDIVGVVLMGIIFFINHLFSFSKNYIFEKKASGESLGKIFSAPYARIFPMHITIILGCFFVFSLPSAEKLILLLFMLLKTAIDVGGHSSMHKKDVLI